MDNLKQSKDLEQVLPENGKQEVLLHPSFLETPSQ
jgi:hypothetical protein